MNNNESNISLKFKNYVTGEAKLEKYEKRLKNIKNLINSMPKNISIGSTGTNSYSSQLDTLIKQLDKTSSASKQTQKNLNATFSVASFGTFVATMKKVITTISSYTEKSSAFLENINLYQVAFDGAYEEADRFVNKLTEMYGLDESWLIRNIGLFRQLANAMGLANETSTNLSMLLTQMAIDISSLYNVGIERASSVLQSAMAGQTKPIRGTTGADITMATLQKTLSDLGIDRYIGNLSYAEKRLVTVISLTKQLTQATNDFGRTIDSPANQLRILSEQWERMTRAMGNVFLPILGKILPYLNAILMVITEIINVVAIFLGFNVDDYDYFSGVSDSVLELEDNLNSAGESAKKLKSGLRGFDKLNVITTPSSTSSGVSGGGVSGDILDAFNKSYEEYMSKIKNVEMKATKIRDTIMEWLGFTKQINEKTGDISFKFDHITGGTVLGALATGGTIFLGIRAIGKVLTKLTGLKFANITKLFGKEGTLAKAFGKKGFITSFITSNPKLALIIGLVVTLTTVFAKLYKENEEFREQVNDFFNTIAETFSPILETLKSTLKDLWGILEKVYEDVLKPLGDLLVTVLKPVFEVLIKILNDLFKKVIKPIMEKLTPFIETTLKTAGTILEETIVPILETIIDVLEYLWKKVIEPLMPIIEFAFTKVFEGLGWVLENKILPPFEAFTDVLEWLRKKIQAFADWWNKLSFDAKSIEGNFSGSAGQGGGGGGGRGFANGGLPPVGQLFVANERGPELVGQIGGQSFVANQNQMLDLVKGELATAKGMNNATFIIQVGDEEVARHVINNLQDMAKSNGKPIQIGG